MSKITAKFNSLDEAYEHSNSGAELLDQLNQAYATRDKAYAEYMEADAHVKSVSEGGRAVAYEERDRLYDIYLKSNAKVNNLLNEIRVLKQGRSKITAVRVETVRKG